jgi:Cysteine-rich CPXCG
MTDDFGWLPSKRRKERVHPLQPEEIICPYCGESIDVLVDCSAGHQEYVEDCSICCRPIVVRVQIDDGEVVCINGRAENE